MLDRQDNQHQRHTEQQKQNAVSVDDVVHIKSVARALSISVPRQRSIQAVAKPVQKYEDIHQVQHQRIVLARRIKRAGSNHADEPENREVVRIHPSRHAARESIKRGSLERRQDACLLSLSVAEGLGSSLVFDFGYGSGFGLDCDFHLHLGTPAFCLLFESRLPCRRFAGILPARYSAARMAIKMPHGPDERRRLLKAITDDLVGYVSDNRRLRRYPSGVEMRHVGSLRQTKGPPKSASLRFSTYDCD